MTRHRTLLLLMLVYGTASLLHFAHNAIYIRDYPNLPHWVTPLGVSLSWLGIAALGALGYWLYRRRSQAAGIAVITLYALLGFGGLDHYAIAPMGAHSLAMNLTIMGELAAACALLVYLLSARGST
jgi:hypothetical protein